jgi:putative thiamine transport system ATP-binding protein
MSGLVLQRVEIAWATTGRVLIPTLDLVVGAGEVATLMGPSGSGKSTLLAYVGGFLDRAAFRAGGRVLIDEDDVTERAAEMRRIGILFQDDMLFPHLSVGGNLLFGLPSAIRRDRRARRVAIEDALDQAGLGGFAERDPATLSGGQRARVALLRALLAEPRALLLDEPFNKLDAALRAEFRRFVFDHARKRRLPTLLTTHDVADAESAGGTIVQLAIAST